MKKLGVLFIMVLLIGACATTNNIKPTRDEIQCRENAHIIHRMSPACREAHIYDNHFFLLRAIEWVMNYSEIDGLDEVDTHYRFCQEMEKKLYKRCMVWKEINRRNEERKELLKLEFKLKEIADK